MVIEKAKAPPTPVIYVFVMGLVTIAAFYVGIALGKEAMIYQTQQSVVMGIQPEYCKMNSLYSYQAKHEVR